MSARVRVRARVGFCASLRECSLDNVLKSLFFSPKKQLARVHRVT